MNDSPYQKRPNKQSDNKGISASLKLILEKLPLSNEQEGKSKVKKKVKKGVEKKLKKNASQGDNLKFRSKLKPILGSILSPENYEKPSEYSTRVRQSNASDERDFNFNRDRRNSMIKDEL